MTPNESSMIYCNQLALLVLVMLISAFPVSAINAQEHLIPDKSALLDPDTCKLRDRFFDGLSNNVILRVLVEPSFSASYMVGLRLIDEQYMVFLLIREDCQDGMARGACGDHETNKRITRSYSRAIDKEYANRIASIWKTSLLDVRRERNPSIHLDGSIYNFSMRLHKYGDISGTLYDPDPRSKMSPLIDLVDYLYEYSKSKIDEKGLSKHLLDFENWK